MDATLTPSRAILTTTTFEERLAQAQPNKAVRISCIDYREGDIQGFHLTSAGARVHSSMLEDLHLILGGKSFLVIQGHSDCAKTKSMNPKEASETDRDYLTRIDRATLRNLWSSAEILLRDPMIGRAVQDGVEFCVAFHDVHTGVTTFFEAETQQLINELEEFGAMQFSKAA